MRLKEKHFTLSPGAKNYLDYLLSKRGEAYIINTKTKRDWFINLKNDTAVVSYGFHSKPLKITISDDTTNLFIVSENSAKSILLKGGKSNES